MGSQLAAQRALEYRFPERRLSSQTHQLEYLRAQKNPDVEIVLKKARAPLVLKELLDKLDEGNKLFDEGRYDEAITYFQNILTARPEFYQININIGNAYMKKED
jgi:tetratricopeptide (TPR) repeat protein